MRQLLGLNKSDSGRSGPDAVDTAGNEFELKSATKQGVTTARDVGLHTFDKWRRRYWVVAKGKNRHSGFDIEDIYFLAPSHLEDWMQDLERKIQSDHDLLERVIGLLSTRQLGEEDVKRLRYLVRRGATRNNPKIPWHYILSHGVRIERGGDPAAQLKALVEQFPQQS